MSDGQGKGHASRTGSGREIGMLVGVLMLVAAGSVVTYWVRSGSVEAAGQSPAAAPAETVAPTTRSRAVVPAPTETEVVHADVYFDVKSTRLRADAVRLLQDRAALAAQGGSWALLVQGYADRQGPPEYNRALAERRATAVKQFLVELGIPEASIRVVAIGQEGALCAEPSEECGRLNRRVHVEMRKLTHAAAEPIRPVLAVGDTLDTLKAGRQQP
jgi:outer membrane protein OmpA-like peptidoglycan-associated protein